MAIPITLYKKAAEEYEGPPFSEEEEAEEMMEEHETQALQQEYEQMAGSSLEEKIEWLDSKDQNVESMDAQNWVEEQLEEATIDLAGENYKLLEQALGDDFEYYSQVVDMNEESFTSALLMSTKNLNREEAVEAVIEDLNKGFIGKEIARVKQEGLKEQGQYEEQRDVVRHMYEPGDPQHQMERQFEPGELEKVPSEQDLGAASSIIRKLVSIANQFDQKGLYEEASIIDQIIKGN